MAVSFIVINLFFKKLFLTRHINDKSLQCCPKWRPGEAEVSHVISLASACGSTVSFQTDYINCINIHSVNNIAILSPNSRSRTGMNDRIVNILIQCFSNTFRGTFGFHRTSLGVPREIVE
jgi:hypothetical protein